MHSLKDGENKPFIFLFGLTFWGLVSGWVASQPLKAGGNSAHMVDPQHRKVLG